MVEERDLPLPNKDKLLLWDAISYQLSWLLPALSFLRAIAVQSLPSNIIVWE